MAVNEQAGTPADAPNFADLRQKKKDLRGLLRQLDKLDPNDRYAAHRESSRKRMADASREGRDIGELPAVADPERKAAAEGDFRFYCEQYFPDIFYLGWSDDHLKVINRIEESVLRGGLFALAMPRGSGKTSLAETACLWAMLNGHQQFICLIGSEESSAREMMESLKVELETNDRLLADYPEVCFPIRAIDGISHRCGGQLFKGQRTHIGWTSDELVLPMIPGSKAAGALVRVAGLTGRIRGMKYKRPDGVAVRPSLVIVDDPQTDESARSPSQCAMREMVLAGAVLGLAGPGKKISGIMPCTVIRPNDMADAILDREKHPEWQGERTKLIYDWPTNQDLWDKYADLRRRSFQEGGDGSEATEFYAANREAMDAGSRVAWPARHRVDELSALQFAVNMRLADERSFFAEYQNEPLAEQTAEPDLLTADQIACKTNGVKRAIVPLGCSRVTGFIDVQKDLLYYTVVAWEDDFTGYVIDYGAYPEQQTDYFALADARTTLSEVCGTPSLEASIYAGLEALVQRLAGQAWQREDLVDVRVDQLLIDANWGESTGIVKDYCKRSVYSHVLMASHGRYFGASSVPMDQYRRKRGERIGHNWRVVPDVNRRYGRHVTFDTNYWKSFCQSRLVVPLAERGCLSLFKANPQLHRLFSEHLTAEYRIRTEGRGRVVHEWKSKANRPDNHWLDCIVGSAVAASMLGVAHTGAPKIAERPAPMARPRNKINLTGPDGRSFFITNR